VDWATADWTWELSLFALERTSQISRGKQFRVLIGSACLPRQKQIKPISLFSSRLSVLMMLPTGLFREAEHLLTTSKEKPAGMKPAGLIASARSGAWLLAHPRVALHRPHGVRCPHLTSSGCTQNDIRNCVDWDSGAKHRDVKTTNGDWVQIARE
jgi:hypothetical protein